MNDETIIASLLSYGSIRRAAKCIECSETTIRKRLQDEVFRKQYETAKAEILSEACNTISANLSRAIDTLSEVLDDNTNPATVRISAADSILRHGLRYIEAANILTRIDALEALQRDKEGCR